MNKGTFNLSGWVWLAVAVLVTAPAAAQQPPAAGAAGTQSPQVAPYTVGQAKPPVVPGSTVLNLTLDEAMAIALENNVDLAVARMNPQGVDYQLQAARAAYLPRLTGSFSYSDSTSTTNFSLDGVSKVSSQSQNVNTTISQSLPWHGSSFSANFRNGRSASNQVTNRFNPSFSSSVDVSFTQPLLADFKIDSQRNQLRTLQITRQISDIQLLATIENTKASVRQAFWALRSALEQIEIQRQSLALAERLFEDNKIRVEIGTMAPIETTTSEIQVVNGQQALLNAQIGWRTAELNLKRLLVNGPDDELHGRTINPLDLPTFSPPSVDVESAVRVALADRTDVTQSRRNIDLSRLNLEVTKNVTLPSLDLTATYRLSGTAGALGDALGSIGAVDNPTWSVSANFTYPLGMAQAKANYARAQLQMDQSLAQLKAQELNISTEVTNAGLAVQNTYLQLQAATKSREVSETNAEAEQIRFDNGMSNNYNVSQALNQLTTARLTELSRIIAYVNAVAEFERVQRVGR